MTPKRTKKCEWKCSIWIIQSSNLLEANFLHLPIFFFSINPLSWVSIQIVHRLFQIFLFALLLRANTVVQLPTISIQQSTKNTYLTRGLLKSISCLHNLCLFNFLLFSSLFFTSFSHGTRTGKKSPSENIYIQTKRRRNRCCKNDNVFLFLCLRKLRERKWKLLAFTSVWAWLLLTCNV